MKVRYPDGNVLLRNLNRDFPVIAHGRGSCLYDTDGKRYLDASGGALVVSVGHGNHEVIDAVTKQLSKVAYVNGTHFTSEAAESLAQRLCERAKPFGLNRAFFLSSGSEAIEAALKLARQVWVERKKPERHKIIARVPSYHGNTLGALSVSGRPHYRKLFGPYLMEVATIPAPYRYRSEIEDYARLGGRHYAHYLEKAIVAAGPESVAAFIVEPIIGSSAAGAVPPADYFDHIQAICRKYQVIVIADEVMCGTGRTGKFFACEQVGLRPDILVLGKGINGGYAPLSVVLTKNEFVKEIQSGSGSLSHAQTYMQSPCMVAVGCAILDQFERLRLLDHVVTFGTIFHERLKKELLDLPHVGHIDGIGFMAGVEFVEDKATKKPFDRRRKVAERLVQHAFERGLILWPNVGNVDGTEGDLIMLGPPLTSPREIIDEIVDSLRDCLKSFAW